MPYLHSQMILHSLNLINSSIHSTTHITTIIVIVNISGRQGLLRTVKASGHREIDQRFAIGCNTLLNFA